MFLNNSTDICTKDRFNHIIILMRNLLRCLNVIEVAVILAGCSESDGLFINFFITERLLID